MIKWIINKIAIAIWNERNSEIKEIIKEKAIKTTGVIITQAFKYNSPLKYPDTCPVSFLSDAGNEIGEKLQSAIEHHVYTNLHKLIISTTAEKIEFLNKEEFIDSIVERINKKQVG